MNITLQLPEHLVGRIRPVEEYMPQVIEIGLREWQSRGETGFAGLADVLERLAKLPTPEEVLALHPSPTLQERIEALLEKNQLEGLSLEEQQEWERYEYVEHLVRMAKIQAAIKLQQR